jgi:UDP-2-acetamido-3-amino-2,3-dideoxy-glucuronate N-acetyltransferase
MRTPVAVAVVGRSSSIETLARTFRESVHADLRWLLSLDLEPRFRLRRAFPSAVVAKTFEEILCDETLDAVVVAEPSTLGGHLAGRALDHGKHVLAYPPLARTAREAEQLHVRAAATRRQLVIADALRFDRVAIRLRELAGAGTLGALYYVTSTRSIAQPGRLTEDTLWSLVSEEIGLIGDLVDDEPVEVSATADAYLHPDRIDLLLGHLRFATGITARLSISCLERHDEHLIRVVGSTATATASAEGRDPHITIHELDYGASDGERRTAMTVFPEQRDPLAEACESFLLSLQRTDPWPAISRQATRVASVLEALERSLMSDGEAVTIADVVPERRRTPLEAT